MSRVACEGRGRRARRALVTLETGVFKPRTDARRGPNQAAARAVEIDRSVMRLAGGPMVGPRQVIANRLEKPVLIACKRAERALPTADGYIDLPNTGSAAVPRRSRARRSAAARARREGEGPRRARRTYRRRRNDVPPRRRRPGKYSRSLRPRTKFILRPAGQAPRGPDRLCAAAAST